MLFPIALVLYEIATYLSNDMYLPSLPTLVEDLGIDQDTGQLTLMYWFLGTASMQLILGPVSDRYGRRVVLLGGGVLYIITTLICAMTENISLMLFARFVQGATVCSCVVAGYSAIHEQYDSKMAIKIIAIMGSITILAPAFGPMLGAIVLEVAGWREIFYFMAILAIISVAMLFKVMPETIKEKQAIDLKAILKDYTIITTRGPFLGYALPFCLMFLSLICWIVESPFIIIETHNKSAIYYGVIQMAVFGVFIIGTQITNFIIHRVEIGYIILIGLGMVFVSALYLGAIAIFYPTNLYLVIGGMLVSSLGSAMAFGPLNRCAIDSCKEPMGRRMAIFSTLMGITGVLSTYLVTLFNDKTLNNLVSLVVVGNILAFVVYLLLFRQPEMVKLNHQVDVHSKE